jgi:hypothetical protein
LREKGERLSAPPENLRRSACLSQVAPLRECRYMGSRTKGAREQIHQAMNGFLQYLTPITLGAVAIVLLLGLVNMMRGGSGNRSQLLMRWRVILQFIAIVLMMTSLYFATR